MGTVSAAELTCEGGASQHSGSGRQAEPVHAGGRQLAGVLQQLVQRWRQGALGMAGGPGGPGEQRGVVDVGQLRQLRGGGAAGADAFPCTNPCDHVRHIYACLGMP